MEQNQLTPASPKDIQLTATIPGEMVQSQFQLIDWCANKISGLKAESKELEEAYEYAKYMGWKYETLQRQFNKSVKAVLFYEKLKSALDAGYYIIPNFPVTLFAVRTEKETPKQKVLSYWADHFQNPQELAENKGEYRNPFPLVKRRTDKLADGKERTYSYDPQWDDIEFPVTMAKPAIMEATTRAMALKIFDQFGIMPPTRNDDPVIIGQIIRKNGYQTKMVSFMIAWHLNTNVL